MGGNDVALRPLVHDTAESILGLRREAVAAVARLRQLQEKTAPVRAQAHAIEQDARRAVARDEDILARQILARGLCALETREQLERELAESRRQVARLVTALVRAENRAWGVRTGSIDMAYH